MQMLNILMPGHVTALRLLERFTKDASWTLDMGGTDVLTAFSLLWRGGKWGRKRREREWG